MDRNSQKCRKSEEPEIGTGSNVGTRKSEIRFFFRKSEVGNRKEKHVGDRKSEGGNRKNNFIFKTELIYKIVKW